MHCLDGFYHNFLYTCPNDEKFFRLKVKTLLNIFLVLSFSNLAEKEEALEETWNSFPDVHIVPRQE